MATVVNITTRHPEIAGLLGGTKRSGVGSCRSNQTVGAGDPDLMPQPAIEGGWPEDHRGAN
jgi:hypothetical protein